MFAHQALFFTLPSLFVEQLLKLQTTHKNPERAARRRPLVSPNPQHFSAELSVKTIPKMV
jgi:hypothetical protein